MAKTMKKKAAAKSGGDGKPVAFKAPKITAPSKVRSKGEFFRIISEQTGLARKQVVSVFDAMTRLLEVDLNSRLGQANVGGLMRVKVITRPATKEREGIDPFTKQPRVFKAKPARKVVKVRPLKSLKAMVG